MDRSSNGPKVLIIDDHRVFAEALAAALQAEPEVVCVGTAGDLDEAWPLVEEHRPDVVLMDAYLPRIDGIEGTRRIRQRWPDTQVVVLTGRADLDLLGRAARAGAAGFLPKEADLQEVADAVRTVSRGHVLVDPKILSQLVEPAVAPAGRTRSAGPVELTDRERQVLGLLAEGNDPATIAEVLGISVHTCRGHVKNLLLKLDAHSQLEAVITAARTGLLPGHPLDR